MEKVTFKKPNPPKYKVSYDTIRVTLGNGEFCILDKSDIWIVKRFGCFQKTKNHVTCERAIKTNYSSIKEKIYIHRLVMLGKAPHKRVLFQVDHINRNSLDNRKENLRWASARQNSANSIRQTISNTGYRGVTKVQSNRKLVRKFIAYCAGKNLGYYMTAEDGALAYDKHAKKRYGCFAILNFPNK